MVSKTFKVPDIHCGHCTHTIQIELAALPGVSMVEADVETRRVTVIWDTPATWQQIKALLVEIDYPPAE